MGTAVLCINPTDQTQLFLNDTSVNRPTHTYTCICIHTYIYLHVLVYIESYIYTYIYSYTRRYTINESMNQISHANRSGCTYICTYTHIHIYLIPTCCILACQVCLYTYRNVFMSNGTQTEFAKYLYPIAAVVHIYIYINIHTHTHIHFPPCSS